ncbi:hypothetical protein JAAARDRAFT_40440 [Jaapia argillacea MUCL 33604]|uniref:Uncharacterized protein n=1 Tax=Jaapia argillacea MUCL 33604 TaxID=933084 RepID=A0A067PEP5_9AGAM|nr:hypothetical protein JAAARDRAFT_40440 [Jaapia argillacea MUCL 33604]
MSYKSLLGGVLELATSLRVTRPTPSCVPVIAPREFLWKSRDAFPSYPSPRLVLSYPLLGAQSRKLGLPHVFESAMAL